VKPARKGMGAGRGRGCQMSAPQPDFYHGAARGSAGTLQPCAGNHYLLINDSLYFTPAMNVTVFSTLAFKRPFLEQANAGRHQVQYYEQCLTFQTVPLAQGAQAVSVFGSDELSAPVLARLWAHSVRCVLVRATGTDQMDLPAARQLSLRVQRARLLASRYCRARCGPHAGPRPPPTPGRPAAAGQRLLFR
jgi:hypothetical protein